MKVCSFLPAATQMLYDMNLQNMLYGITFECPNQALSEKEILIHCTIDPKNLTSTEIDIIFSESIKTQKSLYRIDETKLKNILPDIIFSQDTCDVCQIDTKCIANAIDELPKKPKIISISPNSLKDVFDSAILIAESMNQKNIGIKYIQNLENKIDFIVDTLRKHKAPLKTVSLLEWIEPIYNCGHWIPHQIGYAGGIDLLSHPNGDSIRTPWEKIVQYNPEILIIAPCGFSTQRTLEEINTLTQKEEWKQLQAVQNNNVFIIDFDLFTQSSASTLTSGIEILAALFHPNIFDIPEYLKNKYIHFQN